MSFLDPVNITVISYAPPAQGQAVPLFPAVYMLLTPHHINTRYYDRGMIVTENSATGLGDIPTNWVPTLAVDPLNTRAVNAYWSAGPRGIAYEDLAQWANSLSTYTAPAIKPATFWIKTGNQYSLTGLGSDLPPVLQ